MILNPKLPFGGVPKPAPEENKSLWDKAKAQFDNLQIKEQPEGMVLYCDAGARPNPGYAGWGVHGYLYRPKEKKTSAGHSTHFTTYKGYQLKNTVRASKEEQDQEVDVIAYIDNVGAFGPNSTNNSSEILAAAYGLEIAAQYAVKKVLLYSDSRYTVDGITKWIDKWVRFNWRKPDGSEYSNKEQWKRLKAAKDVLEQRGVQVSIEWMYGHVGDVGNERADSYATIGVMKSNHGEVGSMVSVSPADGYWRYDPDRHPMLGSRALYYLNNADYNVAGRYYTGAHGKDDEALGTRMTEGSFSIVILDEPDPIVELVRNSTIELAQSRRQKESVFMLANLDSVYRPETHRLLNEFGKYALVSTRPHLIAITGPASDELVASELTPSRNSFRAIHALEELDQVLNKFKSAERDESVVITDLTDILYETVVSVKGKKQTSALQLKADYNVGFAALKVQAKHKALGNEVSESEVNLILGIDLPSRNSLKRLEVLEPKVSLVTWVDPESTLVFRYATVIEAKGCTGIWSGHYSNYRYLGEALASTKGKAAKKTKVS